MTLTSRPTIRTAGRIGTGRLGAKQLSADQLSVGHIGASLTP